MFEVGRLGQWLRRPLILALLIGLIYITFSVALGLYSTKLIPASSGALAHYPSEIHNRLNPLAEWDSRFYLNIAQHGYTQTAYAAFFPLYSLVVWPLAHLFGSTLNAALVVSWLCLIGAIYFYIKLLKLLFGRLGQVEISNNLLLFLLFPTAVFLVAAYAESLFALLALASIYFVLKNRLTLAFLLVGLSAVTRLNGLFVWVLLVILCWENRLAIKKVILNSWLGLVPFGLWLVFLAHKFGNPLEFLQAEKQWGHFNGSYFSSLSHSFSALNFLAIVAVIITVVYWLRSRHWGFALYSLLYLLVPFISGSFDGFNRYILMTFPLQWMLIKVISERRWLYAPTIAGFAALWSYFIIQYFGGYTGG